MGAGFKVEKILAPLTRSLAPGGRLLAVQSWGRDPAAEIVERLWPGERPFTVDRHALARHPAGGAGRRRRPLRADRPLRRGGGLPLRDAHAAVRDRRPHRHLDALRRLERRHLREPDRGRAPRGGAPRRAATSRSRRMSCTSMARSGSTTRRSSSSATELADALPPDPSRDVSDQLGASPPARSAVIAPTTPEANPHCGLIANRSSGTYRVASSTRATRSSGSSSVPSFVVTSPSTT